MPRLLTKIELEELSIVDDPANQHSYATIYKHKKGKNMADQNDITVGKLQKALDEVNKKLADTTAINEAMTKQLDDIKVEKELLEKKSKMSDKEKEYMDDMDDEDEKKKFLEATEKQRADMIEKARSGDEEITVNGNVVRKSNVGDAVFEAMKSQQEQLDKQKDDIEKANKERIEKEIDAVVKTKYQHVAGTDAERAVALKAIRDLPEDAQKALTAIMDANEKLAKAAFEQLGVHSSYTPTEQNEIKKARSDFETKVKEEIEKSNCTKATAMQRVAAANPELAEKYNAAN